MNPNVAKAVSHPLRMRILMILNRRVASPSELASELGEPLNLVSYHVKRLEALKCVELVRTEARRGAVEHYYRAVERPLIEEEEFAALPIAVRRGLADAVLSQIAQDLGAASANGGFARDGAHASNTQLDLDEEGWKELAGVLEQALSRFLDIQADAANRIAGHNSETFQANVSLMLFEKPEHRRTSSPR